MCGRKVMRLTSHLSKFLFFEEKTSIAALYDFGQGKILWVGVSITLLDARASTSINN